ncbi:MAG TPA: phosphatidylserine decarboxylase [Pyrinomonadaceae bacterium]|nr:phosphatidylserine decarboxylase [Pyrinomonadaceae bacterium]
MVKEGLPFVLVPAVAALVLGALQLWIPAALLALLAAFMAFFFRDPYRNVPNQPGIIVSAADGRVTRVEETDDGKVVSVFLSPLDVHINRSPVEGTIKRVEYVEGKKRPATSNEASIDNERNSLTIENESITVVCTQIAGIMARRIVCWNREGDILRRGEKFGLIKFGSRTDLLMPNSVEVLVKIGDRVRGGESIIARYGSLVPVTVTDVQAEAGLQLAPG